MCTCVLVVAELSYWPAGYSVPRHFHWHYASTYILYSHFLENTCSIFFLLKHIPSHAHPLIFCPLYILALPFPTGSLLVLFSFFLSLNILFSLVASSATPKIEAVGSLKKSVNFYQTTEHHIPGQSILLDSIFRVKEISNNTLQN